MKRVAVALSLLCAGVDGCDLEVCAEETVEVSLAAPGDTVEVVIKACFDDPAEPGFEFEGTLAAKGTATGPIILAIEGGILYPSGGSSWSLRGQFYTPTAEDCEVGRTVTLRRLDAETEVSIAGELKASAAAPRRKSCELTLASTPAE